MVALFILLCFSVPALLLWLSLRQAWARKVGIIVLCYAAGLLVGNAGLIPLSLKSVQSNLADVTIALAMPLLLFTLDVRQWRHVAGKAMLSMLFATTAVVTLATTLFFLFSSQGVASASNFAAMSVGVYTGGTPNLAAIKSGLAIPDSEFIVFHSLDTLVGALYLLFMLTLGVRLFRQLLPAVTTLAAKQSHQTNHLEGDDYAPVLRKENFPEVFGSLVLAGLVLGTALVIQELLSHVSGAPANAAVVIVAITTLGILLSLVPRVRQLLLSYKLGMYLIYVFCFVVASMASLDQLVDVDVRIVLFLCASVFGSLVLHAMLCRLFKVDGDTFMVTSVAAVASPPFVPMMARALQNPATILSGMTAGIIGYALGNYLGITLGLLLQRLS